jgi:hypothetical protein
MGGLAAAGILWLLFGRGLAVLTGGYGNFPCGAGVFTGFYRGVINHFQQGG